MAVLADVGLPMIFFQMPYLVLALVPVTLAEALVYRAGLPISFPAAFRGALVSNLWSTLLGVPVTWFVLVVLQISVRGDRAWGLETPLARLAAVTVQAPWLIPYEHEFYWMVPAASLVLMVPFFLASVVTERVVLLRWWPEVDRRKLTRLVWLGNLLSYGMLAAYWGMRLILAAPR